MPRRREHERLDLDALQGDVAPLPPPIPPPPPSVDAAHLASSTQMQQDDGTADRVWDLWLRGSSQARIARELGIHQHTVSKLLRLCRKEVAADRRLRLAQKLDDAIARLRRIQEQAWRDHDADEERERMVLEELPPGSRFTSQRAAYLRLVLDCEREVSRLEGLYESPEGQQAGVAFSVRVVNADGVTVAVDALGGILTAPPPHASRDPQDGVSATANGHPAGHPAVGQLADEDPDPDDLRDDIAELL